MIENEMRSVKQLTRIADALEKLVEQNEKMLSVIGKEKTKQLQEKELKALMQSPKYWKEQDPETVKRVNEGFKLLYG